MIWRDILELKASEMSHNISREMNVKSDLSSIMSMATNNWASEASPTLGCSIEISRDIYMYVCWYVSYVKLTA